MVEEILYLKGKLPISRLNNRAPDDYFLLTKIVINKIEDDKSENNIAYRRNSSSIESNHQLIKLINDPELLTDPHAIQKTMFDYRTSRLIDYMGSITCDIFMEYDAPFVCGIFTENAMVRAAMGNQKDILIKLQERREKRIIELNNRIEYLLKKEKTETEEKELAALKSLKELSKHPGSDQARKKLQELKKRQQKIEDDYSMSFVDPSWPELKAIAFQSELLGLTFEANDMNGKSIPFDYFVHYYNSNSSDNYPLDVDVADFILANSAPLLSKKKKRKK